MSERLAEALRQHHHEQQQRRVAAGELWHELNLVVATEVGTPVYRAIRDELLISS